MMVLNTTYFGPVEWYSAIVRNGGAAVCDSELYRRQTLRNRCHIATANGVQMLTVPVTLPESARGGKYPVCDVRISSHGNWRHLHWQALQAAYGMSPFFDYYADDLRPFFERKWDFLFDFNMEITSAMLRLLGISVPLSITSSPVTLPCEAIKEHIAPYYQTFMRRHGFLPGMSVIDLLCNEGPEGVLKLNGGGRQVAPHGGDATH